MANERTTFFTAREYAEALGVTRQAIAKQFRGIEPAAVKFPGGVRAPAWDLAQVPPAMREALAAKARQLGFRDVVSMLTLGVQRWQPSVPLHEISSDDLAYAQRLQRALVPSLNRTNTDMPAAEFEALGLEDYRREFGNSITARYLRELLATVRQRDGGAGEWHRTELFLPGKIARVIPAATGPEHDAKLSALADYVGQCANPLQLTELEKRGLWAKACEEHERLVSEGWSKPDAARTVRDSLAALAPFSGTDRHALRMQFNRKLEKWRDGHSTEALRDGRQDNGAPVILPQSDFDQVIACAARRFRGEVAPAVRYLIGQESLSPVAMARYGHVMDTRGYCPKPFAENCGYKAWLYYLHAMDKLDEETGSIERDWESMPSLRVYSADDLTPCVYFYVPDGKDWFRLVRGQLLVFEDFSSGMILGYSLQPDAQYNSLVIRSLCTHVFAKYGVPTGLYFENGLWRRSVLLKGRRDTLSHAEVTRGLEDLGIRFTHTKHPWSKPIEKSFDLLQTLMQSEPGYCGREEKYDLPPEMKRAKQLVESRKAHPASLGLHSFESWRERIGQLCQQFNRTKQAGKRCGNMTPAEACEARLVRDVNGVAVLGMTFTPAVRHKLALHREMRRVTAAGINVKIGNARIFRYRGPETAHLIGRMVMTGFDPENPELLTVEDPETGLVLCLPQHEKVNPAEKLFAEADGALEREHARVSGQVESLRAYFKALDCEFALPKQAVIADALTMENGRRIEQGKQRIREHQTLTRRAADLAETLGVHVAPESVRNVTKSALEQAKEWLKGTSE